MTINYYEYIGLTQAATRKEIKDRCNRLIIDYAAIPYGDICFEEANETTRLLIEIRQTLLDNEKRKIYDLMLSGVSYKNTYVPPVKVVRRCKDKDNELCYEEEGIVLPSCSGCPKCTDPKVLNRRKEQKKEYVPPRRHKSTNGSSIHRTTATNAKRYGNKDNIYDIYKPTANDSSKKKDSVFKRILKKVFK